MFWSLGMRVERIDKKRFGKEGESRLSVMVPSSLVSKEGKGSEKRREEKRIQRRGRVCGTDDPTGCTGGGEARGYF